MLFAFLGVVAIALFLMISEIAWRKGFLWGELSRKSVHIVVGSFVAVWPFFTDMIYVFGLALAFIFVIILSKQLRLFKSIHTVPRQTYGEVLFPIAILLAAIFAKSEWIFAVAVLHLSLADGLAAVIGTYYGRANRYKVFGEQKSITGTVTFLVVSALLVEALLIFGVAELEPGSWRLVFFIPLVAALMENIGRRGLDNILVPSSVLLIANLVLY